MKNTVAFNNDEGERIAVVNRDEVAYAGVTDEGPGKSRLTINFKHGGDLLLLLDDGMAQRALAAFANEEQTQ